MNKFLRKCTIALGTTVSFGIIQLVQASPSMASLISLKLEESPSPFGFVPLASLGISPFPCPSDCDDGGFLLDVPAFDFAGDTYSSVIWSINGTLEVGTNSGITTNSNNQNLPDAISPNNILAPLWTDLDLRNRDLAQWYVRVLSDGSNNYTVYEWNNVPQFDNPDVRFSFQTWVQNGPTTNGHSNIWFVYDQIDSIDIPMTVGVENFDSIIGSFYYYNGTGISPIVGTDLMVRAEFATMRVPESSSVPALLSIIGLATLSSKFKSNAQDDV